MGLYFRISLPSIQHGDLNGEPSDLQLGTAGRGAELSSRHLTGWKDCPSYRVSARAASSSASLLLSVVGVALREMTKRAAPAKRVMFEATRVNSN